MTISLICSFLLTLLILLTFEFSKRAYHFNLQRKQLTKIYYPFTFQKHFFYFSCFLHNNFVGKNCIEKKLGEKCLKGTKNT